MLASASLYLLRLGETGKGSGTDFSEDERALILNPDLPPPREVRVSVDKGATVAWEGEEGDMRVIGYNIYRYSGEGDSGERVNAAIVSDTVYHDDDGTMFNSYAVAPVDQNGREGRRSEPVAPVAEPKSLSALVPMARPVRLEDMTFRGQPAPDGLPPKAVDCTADGMSYVGTWYLERYAEVTGGTLMVTPYAGSYLAYTFAGDGVAVISTRHWNYGIMEVYVDGELRAVVDLFATETLVKQRVFEASGLGPGAHTIKLACTGRRNPSANFTFIDVEALEVLSGP